jgi:cytochrome c oxidase subunit 3
VAERVSVHEPFRDAGRQHEADVTGMYIFLGTEMMLFGGLFAAIFVTRFLHPQDVVETSKRLHVVLGAVNTAILLTSSLSVALAVRAARAAARGRAAVFLILAAVLGAGFLGLKAYEYVSEYREGLLPLPALPLHVASPAGHLFLNLYLVATGLHALHLTIGIILIAALAFRIWQGWLPLPRRAIVAETCGLYWHFVDVVWVFLYPALYLVR